MGNGFTEDIGKKARRSNLVLGENIRRKRTERNISQEELAERLDISRQSISKWETGLSEPSAKNLTQLARIFRCELSELIGAEEPPEGKRDFAVIGVEAVPLDMGRLQAFFQELPLDIMDCCGASIMIAWSGVPEEKEPLEELVRKYTEHGCRTGFPEEILEPDAVYLADRKSYGGDLDGFFGTLARRYGENTVAVIFSDCAKNGRDGVEQVKKAGGICFLCEPEKKTEEAPYQYWNAPDTGLFDYVLEPVNMGYWIANHVRKRFYGREGKYQGFLSERFYHRVYESLKNTGVSSYGDFKEEYIIRFVRQRIEETGVSSLEAYGRMLKESPDEQNKLAERIRLYMWKNTGDGTELLELAGLIEEIKPEINGIRIWIAGSGKGLDAYVAAMMLSDYMEHHRWYDKIKIFATDAEEELVSEAIKGIFEPAEISNLPEEWKRKYFQKKEFGFQVSQVIRNMIIFSVHDILNDPPFSRLDLLICRDVMKKFRIRSRKTIIARFSYALNQNGYLVLGKGEDIGELCNWFVCEEQYQGRIWRKQKSAHLSVNRGLAEKESLSVGKVVEELLTASMPACIIVDERQEILYTGKEAGKYLQFKAGKFSKNLFDNVDRKTRILIDMALKYLEPERDNQKIMVVREGENGEDSVNIYALGKMIREHCYYLIWFESQEDREKKNNEYEFFNRREEKLERELDISQNNLYQAIKELDDTRDKYELINEKLQSANEELTLMNDELQMTNQELAASNRKLTRVNVEYQRRLNEMPDFSREGIDFFELMGLQTVFLDRNFCVKKFSEDIPHITNIKEYDIDRSMADMNLMNGYLGWREDVKAAGRGERVLRVVDGQEGSRYVVQLLPYGPEGKKPFGYVIVIQNIQRKRRAEE